MKLKWTALFVLALVATTAAAHPSNHRMLYVSQPILVNGAQVPAGIYQLTWETHDSTANITLSKDGKFVAGEKGAWVKEGTKYRDNAILLRVNSDGSRSLMEIRLSGSKKTIVFSDPIINVDSLRSAPHKTSDD